MHLNGQYKHYTMPAKTEKPASTTEPRRSSRLSAAPPSKVETKDEGKKVGRFYLVQRPREAFFSRVPLWRPSLLMT
jgi:hypothetical protein